MELFKTGVENTLFMEGFIITYRVLNAFAKIDVFAIAMQCCSKNISASQFTIYMTTKATGFIAGATLIGPIKENFIWEISFLFFVGFMLLALAIMSFLHIDMQIGKMNELEKQQSERKFRKSS